MQVKTHFFISAVSSLEAGKTACGMRAWEESHTEHEATTATGGRIDITRRVRDVTCARCIAANPKQ